MGFSKHSRYKHTGVKWLGEFPTHWESKPLWTMFRRIKRTGFANEELLSVYRDYGVIPKSSRDDNFNKPSENLSAYQLVEPSDLVTNKMKAWQGSVAISKYRGIVSPAYHVYECLHDEDSRFLHYLMRSLRYITGYLSMSKGIRINQWDLEPQLHSRMPVLLPPLDEQKAISSFLDVEISKIDGLVSEQRRLIELLKEKRQAVISHAVTKGLNPNAPMKPSGIQWLGDVPQHWSLTRIKHLTDGFMYGTSSNCNQDDDGTPVLRIPNVKDGFVDFAELKYANFSSEDEERYLLRENDIVVVRTNGNPQLVGKSALFTGQRKCMFASYLIKIQPRPNVVPAFLNMVMNAPCTREMLTLSARTSAGNYNMNCEGLGRTHVILPPLAEQQEILSHSKARLEKLSQLQAEAEQAIELLQERRSALISAAVTGKIDVREFTFQEAV